MKLALHEAWKYQLLTYPNPAVGALIIDENFKVLSIGSHKKAGDAHAELDAVIKALDDKKIDKFQDITSKYNYIVENYKDYFKGSTIYVTLEPCNHIGKTPACSLLIEKMGFSRVVIGATEQNSVALGGGEYLKKIGVEVVRGVLEKECNNLIYPFLRWTKYKQFIFFKIATSLNGVYDGGIISSYRSREYVHLLRDKIDLLVIGGESVRVDRPTLDSRFVGGKAPDILIVSKRDDFDKDIPLFKVNGRKVYIEDNLDKIKEYKFIMLEGGNRLFDLFKDRIDMMLIFRSANIKSGKVFRSDINMEYLYTLNNGIDNIEWLKESS